MSSKTLYQDDTLLIDDNGSGLYIMSGEDPKMWKDRQRGDILDIHVNKQELLSGLEKLAEGDYIQFGDIDDVDHCGIWFTKKGEDIEVYHYYDLGGYKNIIPYKTLEGFCK